MGNRNLRDLVFLGLAVVFLLAAVFLVKRPTVSSTSPPPASPAAKANATVLPPVKTGANLPLPAGAQVNSGAFNPFSNPIEVKDPNAPVQLTGTTASPPTPTPTPTPVITPSTPAPTTTTAALPPLATQTTTAKPTVPVFQGFVDQTSSNPTVLITYGDKTYQAKQGEKIAGQYRVKSISVSDRKVVLVSTQGELPLKLGKMGGS